MLKDPQFRPLKDGIDAFVYAIEPNSEAQKGGVTTGCIVESVNDENVMGSKFSNIMCKIYHSFQYSGCSVVKICFVCFSWKMVWFDKIWIVVDKYWS